MTPDPVCVGPHMTALELVKAFHARQFRHLLVVDDNRALIGVISDRDVQRCFGPDAAPADDALERIVVRQLMSTDLVTTDQEASLADVTRRMLDFGINCLPVVSGRKLVGILTSTDLLLVLESLLQSALPESSQQPDEYKVSAPQN